MRPLWASVREHPADAGNYFLLSVALLAHGWMIAGAACLTHVALLRQAEGACSAEEVAEMLREADAIRHNAQR